MVGSKMLSQVNSRLKAIMDNSLDFGGVSIICVGDFHQLRPVKDCYVFLVGSSDYDGLVGPYLWEKFSYVKLTEIMRQKDDQKFALALKNLANCSLTEADVNLFESRYLRDPSLEKLPTKAIHLFSTNASVNVHNNTVLNALTAESFKFIAIDTLVGDKVGNISDQLRSTLQLLKVSDTQGLPYELYLKIGARYLMTLNNDTSDGLVNGATGILQKMEYGTRSDTQERVPCVLWLDFDDPTVGTEKRSNSVSRYFKDHTIQRAWTPIVLETRRFQRGKGAASYRIVRKQFPFIVAEAITIHKSQGDTYDCVVVHIDSRMPRNALYTALSRAKSASGLYIVGQLKLAYKVSERDSVFHQLKRLEESCSITWSIPLASSDLYVHNVRSLNKHWEDLTADPIIFQSRVLILQETMTITSDSIDIPGHYLIGRVDGDIRTAGCGSRIYARDPAACKLLLSEKNCLNQATIEILVIEIFDNSIMHEAVIVISVYRSPRAPLKQLFTTLDGVIGQIRISCNSIKTGDFNVDLCARHPDRNIFLEYMASKEFFPTISGVSTNYGSQLDCVFTKCNMHLCQFYESYFSDHKPILISLNTVRTELDLNISDTPYSVQASKGIIADSQSNDFNVTIDNTVCIKSTTDTSINQTYVDLTTSPVYAPLTTTTPAIGLNANVNTFSFAMRQALADSIGLDGIPIRPTDFNVRALSSSYYRMMSTNIRDRFNLRIVPVIADGNCFFRTLSHIIFGDQGEHHNIRASLINSFEQSPYVDAFCDIQGYNFMTIQHHFNDMRRNYTWGTVNELIMLGILARINVSYVNAVNRDPYSWVITEVYNGTTLGIPSDPIYEGKALIVLYHSINFAGPSAYHYDAVYFT